MEPARLMRWVEDEETFDQWDAYRRFVRPALKRARAA
jgi:hypothetical protein